MGRRIYIYTGHCCGAICAYIYKQTLHNTTQIDVIHDDDAWDEYAKTSDTKEEKKIEWKSWYKNILTMLKRLVERGKITQDEAEEALKEWLRDNPNPDPEEELYNVTEEFARQPIRIELPQKVERE